MEIICTAIKLATFIVTFVGAMFALTFCVLLTIQAAYSLVEHLIEKWRNRE